MFTDWWTDLLIALSLICEICLEPLAKCTPDSGCPSYGYPDPDRDNYDIEYRAWCASHCH